MLRNWRNGSGGRDAGSARPPIPASAPHPAVDPAAEISRLRRENDRLRTERDILKKGCGHLLGTAEIRESRRQTTYGSKSFRRPLGAQMEGQLLDVDLPHLRQQLGASRDFVFAATGIRQDLLRSN
jgi:hypothetical protein